MVIYNFNLQRSQQNLSKLYNAIIKLIGLGRAKTWKDTHLCRNWLIMRQSFLYAKSVLSDFVWWPVSSIFRKRKPCRKKLLKLRCKLKLWLQSKWIYTPFSWSCGRLSYRPPHLKQNHWNKNWEFKLLQQISSEPTSVYENWLLIC